MKTDLMPRKMSSSKAKYEVLRNELIAGIVGGRFRADEPLPSENEIVAEAGVSRSTVRLALDGLELEGYISRIRGKGTFVKADYAHRHRTSAQSGKRLAHNFVMPMNRIFAATYRDDTSNVPFARNLEETLQLEGFRLSVVFFDEHHKKAVFEDLLNSPNYCDGLVLLTGLMDEVLAAKLISSKVAHVCVDSDAEQLGLNTVCDNAVDGMHQAISHLKRLGHERITFLGAVKGSRYGFFKAAMAETNTSMVEPIHIEESFNWFNRDTACNVFGQWLDNERTATAVICQTDGIAFGAIEAMRQRELRAGHEISIIGHDNIEERDKRIKSEPMLTTIDDGIDILGKRCGELLLNQVLREQRQIVHEYIPVVKLIARQTTGPHYPKSQVVV